MKSEAQIRLENLREMAEMLKTSRRQDNWIVAIDTIVSVLLDCEIERAEKAVTH